MRYAENNSVKTVLAWLKEQGCEITDRGYHGFIARVLHLLPLDRARELGVDVDLYVSLYPGFTVNAAPLPAAQLLVVALPKDRPLAPIYGKMTAEWQVDHWQFSILELQLPQLPAGEGNPRASFRRPILIQGDLVTERILAAAKAAISEAKPKKVAIEGSYQADLIRATRPGTIYKGQISRGGSTMAAEVQFTEPTGNDPSLARCELRLPSSGYIYTCSAKLAKRIPIQPASLTGSEGNRRLTLYHPAETKPF